MKEAEVEAAWNYRFLNRKDCRANLWLAKQPQVCFFCGDTTKGFFTVDHKIPKCRGGRDNPINYAVSCRPCNHDKSHLTVDEYNLVKAYRVEHNNPHPFNNRKHRK